MPEVDIQRLLGPEAREIFMQFPLPLAMVTDAGDSQFNARFSQFFDPGCIGALIDFLANDVVARHLFTAERDYYPLFLDEKP